MAEPTAHRTTAIICLATLGACAGASPDVDRLVGTSPRDARLALELAADEGPVRGRVEGLPQTADAETIERSILAVMGDAVAALPVLFTPAGPPPPPSPALVVTLGALPGANPCIPPPALGEPERVVAAFCENDTAIGAVVGTLVETDDAARTQLYRRLARDLFPNLYAERYGIGYGLETLGVPFDHDDYF